MLQIVYRVPPYIALCHHSSTDSKYPLGTCCLLGICTERLQEHRWETKELLRKEHCAIRQSQPPVDSSSRESLLRPGELLSRALILRTFYSTLLQPTRPLRCFLWELCATLVRSACHQQMWVRTSPVQIPSDCRWGTLTANISPCAEGTRDDVW